MTYNEDRGSAEVERQKELLRKSHTQRKGSTKKKNWQSKLRHALVGSSKHGLHNQAGCESEYVARRQSFSAPPVEKNAISNIMSSSSLHGVLRRNNSTSNTNAHNVGGFFAEIQELKVKVEAYEKEKQELLIDAQELLDENEYLAKEVETIQRKQQAACMEADVLALKLNRVENKLEEREILLQETQNVLRKLLDAVPQSMDIGKVRIMAQEILRL